MDDLTDRERIEIWNLLRSEIITTGHRQTGRVKYAGGTPEQTEYLKPILEKIGRHGCNLRIGEK